MISVVVPAHDEEYVIARSLSAMVQGAEPGELEVIVACNGCSDRTAEIARSFAGCVRVIEIDETSKTAALNAADDLARGFPRIYVDADVLLDLKSIRELASVLERGEHDFATPRVCLDSFQSNWVVRAYYRVWTALPYNCDAGQVGTGVYALSKIGRQRFQRFPDVLNDDGFVRLLFHRSERATVPAALSTVQPPRTLQSLIRAKLRVRVGQRQLQAHFRNQDHREPVALANLLRWLAIRPGIWPYLPVYAFVSIVIRCASAWYKGGCTIAWGRDDSRAYAR